MTRDAFLKKRFHLSVTAGMNQRYHQHQAYRFWLLDTSAKILTAAFSFLSFAAAIAAWLYGPTDGSGHFLDVTIDVVGVGISFLAAIVAIILNVLPFASREKEHVDLFRQWTDLRESVEAIQHAIGEGEPSKRLVEELAELDAKHHRICGSEILANSTVWRRCENDERKSRGIPLLNSPATSH